MRMLKTITTAAVLALMWAGTGRAGTVQTDWSGGDQEPGPVTSWTNGFSSATGISWLAVPGQLALASAGLAPGNEYLLDGDQEGAFGIEAADVDGDGDVDLVGAAELAGTLTIWYNNGDDPVTFDEVIVAEGYSGISAICATDLDGDLDLDLVTCSGTKYVGVVCYMNEGGSPAVWTPVTVEDNWGEAWEIAAGDVDGDGRQDIVGTNLSLAEVVWWRNDGADPIGWSRRTVDGSFGGAHSVRAGDIDGDGFTDLVGCGTTINQVAWWRNSGGDPVTWTKQVINGAFSGGRSVRLGDLDRDGDLDVAACGFNGQVAWWSNEGSAPVVWTQHLVDGTLSQHHQMQIADLTGDGWLDLVVAAYANNAVVWYENGGGPGPLAWTRQFADYSLPRPLAVGVGDVNGDGALDILGSSNTTHAFTWYEATSFVSAGELVGSILDTEGNTPESLDWTAVTPPGTELYLQVRGGEDPGALGPWSGEITAPGLLDPALGRYVQVKVVLATSDPAVSPVLEELTLQHSVAAAPDRGAAWGLRAYPNPANPRVIVAFEMPRTGRARLDVFDVRGRRVKILADESFPAGSQAVAWDGTDTAGRAVATGTYQVILQTSRGSEGSLVTLLR